VSDAPADTHIDVLAFPLFLFRIYDRLTEEDQLPEQSLPELDPSCLDPMAFPSPLQSPDLWKIGLF
jgi:hypothetical protein